MKKVGSIHKRLEKLVRERPINDQIECNIIEIMTIATWELTTF